MEIQVNAVHFDADAKLIGFIRQKLNKLDTFFDRILGGEVFLRIDKKDTKKIHEKLLEVKINVPGHSMFVSERAKTFEEATDIAVESLKTQLKRHKDRTRGVVHTKMETIELAEADDELDS